MRDDSLEVPPPAPPQEEGIALSTFPGAMRRDWVWREAAALEIEALALLLQGDKPRR